MEEDNRSFDDHFPPQTGPLLLYLTLWCHFLGQQRLYPASACTGLRRPDVFLLGISKQAFRGQSAPLHSVLAQTNVRNLLRERSPCIDEPQVPSEPAANPVVTNNRRHL